MHTRSNTDMAGLVRKGIEIFLKEGQSNAVSYLKENGVSNRVIARVIYERDQVRKGDIIYKKSFKKD